MAEVDTLLFTSKSVNEGYPDKLCDQISDAVLDACLEQDLDINVTNETCTKTIMDVGENPEIGMMFETLKIAYNYYNSYARRIGFSVRKQRTNKRKYDPNIIDSQTLCCSCEGNYKKNRTPQKRRENRRFECKAEFHLNRVNDRFRLSRFTAEHTHELATTERVHYLRSQRKIQCSQVGLIGKMHSSGISQSNIFSYLSEEAGGAEHLNFIRYDCYNLVQRKRNEFLKKGDVQCLQEWFKQKTRENKFFFYYLWANDDGVVKGIFFCDGKSRRDYGLFGDVICFDTTFNTNNYNMVCAPFVGVNNHGQTTIFGCGLLEGETTDAIVWLFTVFLEAMGGKKPQTIFTDQSAAIAKAIEQIFPEAHHRLCLWHIYQNAAKHLAKSFSEFKSLAKRFKQCIYEPETIAEFEESWEKMLDDHGLKDNDWLQRLFQFRHKWAQVYAHTYFCAGMTTTQRSESINKFLKDYFSTTMIIREFVDQYSKAMTNRREKENMEENRTSQTTPILLSNWDVELEASKIYTKKIFYLFQEEYKKILDLDFKLEDDDGFVCTYTVLELNGRRRNRTLTYHKSEKIILCSCKKFEFHGVLCSHTLSLFRRLDFTSLPEKYYLKRWTRAIKDEVVFDPFGEAIPNDIDPLATIRYSELSHLSQRIVAKGAKSSIKCSLAKKYLLELEEKLDSISDEEQGNTSRNVPILHENVNADEQLRDPKSKRCRGQPKARRKSALETRTQKSNVSSKRMRDMGQNLITAQTREIIQTADGALNLYQPTQGSVNVVIRPEVQQWRTIYPFQPCTTPTPSAPTQESQGLPRRLLYSDTSTYSTDP